jgi:dinuclear metal center YbgI/SA1388 family protein
MPTLASVLSFLESFAPPALAADWDNVGLLLGGREGDCPRVLTCLDLTPDVAAEAVAEKASLVVPHHPILFRGVKRLTSGTAEGEVALRLAGAGISVWSPHTALDNCKGGINDHLAGLLGLGSIGPLRQRGVGPGRVKVVAFVPDGDLARVSEALFAAGAGRIGEYSECSFRLHGTGTFRGSEASNPTVGQKGRREEAPEWRLEVVCPEAQVGEAVRALRAAHSYEEPAYDLYPLAQEPGPGEGRVGELPGPAPLAEMARRVRAALGCGPVGVVGDPGRLVRRVALACGAAAEYLGDAARVGADVFLTGEARHHDSLAARGLGVALILPGHYATERPGVEMLAGRVAAAFPDVRSWASQAERPPVTWE